MNLTDKNKKFLEKTLNCIVEFQEENNVHELYKIKGTIYPLGYNKNEKYYFMNNSYINKFNNSDKIVIIMVGLCAFGFIFVNDLKNINI